MSAVAAELADQIRQMAAAAFTMANAEGQADRDPTALSMSGLGGCTRAAAYAVAGTPASDVHPPEEARAAVLGTVAHEILLPHMAAQRPGAVVEHPVKLHAAGQVIPGTLDLAWPGVVLDLKTVGSWRLSDIRGAGAYTAHRLQVLGYALAHHQAGNRVDQLVWLYLDRATGEVEPVVEPFTNGAALAVVDRVRHITEHARRPDDAPRMGAAGGNGRGSTMRGPGLSVVCDSCSWLRRCWGDDAVPGEVGAQRILARTDAGVEAALALYDAGSAAASEGKADAEFAKAILEDTPDATYGPWSLRRGKPGQLLDQAQVRADYAERGKGPPMRPTAGRMNVTRVQAARRP